MSKAARTIVEGCRLPLDGPLTENERAWVEMLRLAYRDAVPRPSLAAVQGLRGMSQRPED